MDFFQFDPNQLLSFFLTLFRVSIVLFMLPFFGGQSTPNMVKGAIVLILALALWPQLSFPASLMPSSGWEIAIMFAGEVILGLILGMLVQFLFAAVQTGGQLIGFQMGFAMINVVDPVTGVSEAVTAHFLYMVVMLVFLVLNGPLYLLAALGKSFELVPPGGLLLTPELTHEVLAFSEQIFVLAVKIAAPVMAALFLVDLSLALISRAAPQMNVLLIGFPVKIAVGFLFLFGIFEILSAFVSGYLARFAPIYENVMRSGGLM